MPYINSNLTVNLSDEKREIIKARLGEIITTIPEKTEQWLMLGFNDNYTLYFRGDKQEKAAFVEVKFVGAVDRKYCDEITSLICNLFEEQLEIPKDNTYVVFEEIKDWGWNGKLF